MIAALRFLSLIYCFLLIITASQAQDAKIKQVEDELKRVKEWHDSGLLTEEDYKKQNEALLKEYSKLRNQKFSEEELAYCDYIGEAIEDLSTEDSQPIAEDNVLQIVNDILETGGYARNFIISPKASIQNASAVVKGDERFIYYNPKFIESLKNTSQNKWTIYSVFSHEIAHHFNGHTLKGGSRPFIELQADESSGFILQRLGASLEDAQASMKLLGKEAGTDTHPPKNERMEAIAKGWNKAGKINSNNSEKEKNPVVEKEVTNPDEASATRNKYDEVIDKADNAFNQYDWSMAKKLYTEAAKISPNEEYPNEQIALIDIFLNESDITETSSSDVSRVSVNIIYRGDSYNCLLPITIRIGDMEFVPTGNSMIFDDVPVGNTTYEITGTINCSIGTCTAYGSGEINIQSGASYYVMWQNTEYGQCTIGLSYY